MASPEIDEAAAVEWFEWCAVDPFPIATMPLVKRDNAARAALAWKARAEELEALKHALVCAIDSPKDRDRIGEAVVNVLRSYRARAEAAEAERDSLKRQLAQAVKAR